MKSQAIYVDYGTDAACVSYARALSTLLRAELVVGFAPPVGSSMTDGEAERVSTRIRDAVSAGQSSSHENMTVRVARVGGTGWPPAEAILVSNHLQQHPYFPVWRPSGETEIRNPKAPLLIPFGNKPELECGYVWGILLAQRINVPVIFYHTTWPKDGVASERGEDHWHAGAETVACRAEMYARKRGVVCETIVERAASVREGVHQMALLRCVTCIVAQQDADVISGGYHDELIRYGHLVPLVVLPKGDAV